jgi:glyoxalase family protein
LGFVKLDGIHHITAITADAQGNVDFYAGLLGLRFVKKTVNFDAPEVYHLYYGDDEGNPGSILTFFEFPGASRGQVGNGMVSSITWRVGAEGLGLDIVVDNSGGAEGPEDRALQATRSDVPSRHALRGFDGVGALTHDPEASRRLLADVLGFETEEEIPELFWCRGNSRSASIAYAQAIRGRGIQGAGTVHHIAWACAPEDQAAWRERIAEAGFDVTPIIDRTYFRSIYFREPSGVLFEIATSGPGFAIDEPVAELGTNLRLPPQHEHLRADLERTLRPLRLPGSSS